MPAPELTIDQWLADLEAATRANPDGLTAREIGQRLKRGTEAVRRLLRVAKERGVLRSARANREAIDGIQRPIPVYWFVQPAKGVKRR